MAVGKSKRFKIFMRDQFTCQYCGGRPPDVVLELDHIEAVANGGTDEELNLTTSCFDCNRGKRDKRLTDVIPRPDADLEFLKMQQEIVEARRYISSKKERDSIFEEVISCLAEVWGRYVYKNWVVSHEQWIVWLSRYSPEEIEFAIKRAASFVAQKKPDGKDAIRYISAIMKKVRAEAEE